MQCEATINPQYLYETRQRCSRTATQEVFKGLHVCTQHAKLAMKFLQELHEESK